MKRALLAAAVLPLAGLIPVAAAGATTHTAAKPAVQPAPFTCTTDHWIRDISEVGQPLLEVNPFDGDQLQDNRTWAGYPTNYIFTLCTDDDGTFYLQNQIPGNGSTAEWVGVNTVARNAVTDTAGGPGPHEGFSVECAGPNQEYLNWDTSGLGYTIATNPPTVWAGGPVGTLYEISGLCP